MTTIQRTVDGRAGGVVASAFVAGLACTILMTGSSAWESTPEATFRIDDVAVEAERPPVAVDDELPPDAVLLAAKPAGEQPPQRLAVASAPAAVVVAVAAQALPTAGDRPVPGPRQSDGTADLRVLVDRLREDADPAPAVVDLPTPATADAAAPLPGDAWTNPDGSNWSDSDGVEPSDSAAGQARGGRFLGRLIDRRGEVERDAGGAPLGGRLLERFRDRRGPWPAEVPQDAPGVGGQWATAAFPPAWPATPTLDQQLERLADAPAGDPITDWAVESRRRLADVLATQGPLDPAAESRLIDLGDRVAEGMAASDTATDPARGSRTRRAALALARRVSVWRAAAACCAEVAAAGREPVAGSAGAEASAGIGLLLDSIERFEGSRLPADAAAVRDAARRAAGGSPPGTSPLDRALVDHYLAPNVRIAVGERFAEKLLPRTTVTTSSVNDFVLGRQVRGTKTVEQSNAVRFAPHPTEIRLDLLVTGQIASRTVTEAGSVAIHSLGQSTFTVSKPIQLTRHGLAFSPARGSASNESRLAGIESDFDAVPLMGSFARAIARNQHEEKLDQATREVNSKIVTRACREVDRQTEPQLEAAARRLEERFWSPMARLGLEPTAVALETAAGAATARLRLAAPHQLAAHTPRPRPPPDAVFSIQVHESTVNNACDRFGLAGRKMRLDELARHVCTQLGLPPRVPDDLPEGVEVTFTAVDPLRIECREGLVHVRVALDALEGGRRSNWYDVVAQVAYRPTMAGTQVTLDREGPVQLSGPGQRGRMEFGLRTIFGKMFPKERPVPLVPARIVDDPRFADVRAVQAVTADGWLAIALAPATSPDARRQPAAARRPAETAPRIILR